ncbi:class I SAM-dependent methyltransferase [Candidatus Peregrinibacteria bacterium]|nr:class I SAM-dependent methyltransferase [Candidatus Peregrinibacteria bacterium]
MKHQSFEQWLETIGDIDLPIFDQEIQTLLNELERQSEIYWNVPAEVGEFFYKLIVKLRPKRLMEVGTSNGYSAIRMGLALKQNPAIHVDGDAGVGAQESAGKLFTIESHGGRFELAAANIRRAGLTDFVVQIKGHAPEIFHSDENLKVGNFDLLFFDGIKKQHVDFLEQGIGLLKDGGVLIADNVTSHWKDMEAFVRRVEEMGVFEGRTLEIGDGVYVGIKKGGEASL